MKKIILMIALIIGATCIKAQVTDTTDFKSETERRRKLFRETSPNDPERKNFKGFLLIAERRFIQKGDSTRIRCIFNPRTMCGIKMLGGPQATRKELKTGEWLIVVKPEKSTLYEFEIDLGRSFPLPRYIPILVLNEDKYNEVNNRVQEINSVKIDVLPQSAIIDAESKYLEEEFKKAGISWETRYVTKRCLPSKSSKSRKQSKK
ncbi:MAG: hypothetical protein IKY11_03865 [Rikenellaceae bacterium]|nr:hypothetical protein [Rikenellaceae bacterium]